MERIGRCLVNLVFRHRAAGSVDVQLVFLAVSLEFDLPVRALAIVTIVVVDLFFCDGLGINTGVGYGFLECFIAGDLPRILCISRVPGTSGVCRLLGVIIAVIVVAIIAPVRASCGGGFRHGFHRGGSRRRGGLGLFIRRTRNQRGAGA